MSKNIKKQPEAANSQRAETLEDAVTRCYNMLDYMSERASHIILNLIYTNPCTDAKKFLLSKPEELAVKAIQKVIEEIYSPNPQEPEKLH